MIPDNVDDLKAIATKVEQTAHRAGWDAPPVLGYFFAPPGLPGYAVRPMPIDITEIHDAPRIAVEIMADTFRAAREVGEVPPSPFPPQVRSQLAGIWLVTEAWLNTDVLSDEDRAGRMLADIPGSKEVRMVSLLDCGGRYVWVNRIRGEKPTVQISGPGIEAVGMRGPLVDALRDLLLELCHFIPEDQYARAALEKLGA